MAEETNNSSQIASADLGAVVGSPESGGPHIAEAPVSSATYEKPIFPVDGATKPKIPLKLTSGKISLIVIVFLLIVIVVMGTMTLFALTNGSVNVTVSVPNTSSTTTTPPPSNVAVGEPNPTQTTETDIYIYLIAKAADATDGKIDPAALPVGSLPVANTKDYLVPYISSTKYSGSDLIQKALNDLLALKADKLTGSNYRTSLFSSDMTVAVVVDASGKTKVNFKGTWPSVTGDSVNYAKEQVERTIQKYTYNYTATLNGSEVAYRCIGSTDTSCNQ